MHVFVCLYYGCFSCCSTFLVLLLVSMLSCSFFRVYTLYVLKYNHHLKFKGFHPHVGQASQVQLGDESRTQGEMMVT